jgi:hypothetical protein
MTDMALKAKERLTDFQHVVIDRAVRAVAGRAFIIHISVFKGKWPFLFPVTAGTCLFNGIFD